MTDKLLRRGVHKSVKSLEEDALAWVDIWNEGPSHSSGQNLRKKYSNQSGDFSGELKTKDTSVVSPVCRRTF